MSRNHDPPLDAWLPPKKPESYFLSIVEQFSDLEYFSKNWEKIHKNHNFRAMNRGQKIEKKIFLENFQRTHFEMGSTIIWEYKIRGFKTYIHIYIRLISSEKNYKNLINYLYFLLYFSCIQQKLTNLQRVQGLSKAEMSTSFQRTGISSFQALFITSPK